MADPVLVSTAVWPGQGTIIIAGKTFIQDVLLRG
jgi:hypothetical protein